VSKEKLISFAERLRKARVHAGFRNQDSLADVLKISQGTVGNWESGANFPTLKQAIELADVIKNFCWLAFG
jgi:DNA-binding XRE family transcriptional regulator